MKAYIIYTDEGMLDAVVSDNDKDEFLNMIEDNGWNTQEVSK